MILGLAMTAVSFICLLLRYFTCPFSFLGRISQELREALGLHRKSLPMFVYRMRQLGYPPGWLREAELEKSGYFVFTYVIHYNRFFTLL